MITATSARARTRTRFSPRRLVGALTPDQYQEVINRNLDAIAAAIEQLDGNTQLVLDDVGGTVPPGGPAGAPANLAETYANGDSAAHQTPLLTDVDGGPVIFDSTTGTFTGSYQQHLAGTSAAGLLFRLKNSTPATTDAAFITALWGVSTAASESGYLSLGSKVRGAAVTEWVTVGWANATTMLALGVGANVALGAQASGSTYDAIGVNAHTVTWTGTTANATGYVAGLDLGQITIANATASAGRLGSAYGARIETPTVSGIIDVTALYGVKIGTSAGMGDATATSTYRAIDIPSHTITLTGADTAVTGSPGFAGVYVGTITQSGAGVLMDYATGIYVKSAPVPASAIQKGAYAIWSDAGINRFDGTVQLGSDSGVGGVTGVLTFENATSAFHTSFQAGVATASVAYTLPTAGPAVSGYVLASTDAGVMSWTALPAAGVTSVTAGAGLTGGGTGAVTLDVGAGAGIAVAADAVAVDVTYAFGWTAAHSWVVVDAATATTTDILTLVHLTSGTAAAGYGTGILLRGEDDAGFADDMARVAAVWSDAASAVSGAEGSNIEFHTRYSGGALGLAWFMSRDSGGTPNLLGPLNGLAIFGTGNTYDIAGGIVGLSGFQTDSRVGSGIAEANFYNGGVKALRFTTLNSNVAQDAHFAGNVTIADDVAAWTVPLANLHVMPSAAASGHIPVVTFVTPAHTAIALSSEYISEDHDHDATLTWATGGTVTTQRTVVFRAPTLASASATTFDNAIGVDLGGAPSAGSGATITILHGVRALADVTQGASVDGKIYRGLYLMPHTLTYTGTTANPTGSANAAIIETLTVTDASAMRIGAASGLVVYQPTKGGTVSITALYGIVTGNSANMGDATATSTYRAIAVPDHTITLTGADTAVTGSPGFAGVYVGTITQSGAGVLMDYATGIYVKSAPVPASAIQKGAYAIWSDAGINRFDGTVQLGSDSGVGGVTGLLTFEQSTVTKHTSFQAGAATADATYTLPTAAPAVNGYALTATTAGVMSWAAVATSPLTTKGDVWTFSTVDARIAVGATKWMSLSVDASTATGLAYIRSAPIYVAKLTGNHTNATTTATAVSGLSITLAAGTYTFKYTLLCQTDTTTTGIRLGVNYTGTASPFAAGFRFPTQGTMTEIGPVVTVGVANFWSGGVVNAETTTAPNMGVLNFQTINTNRLIVVEGIMVVSDGGDLELWHSSETTTTTTVMAGSAVVITQIA